MRLPGITVVCVTNDPETLKNNLLISPIVAEDKAPLITIPNAQSASEAYYEAYEKITTKYAIFCHQDVYIPRNWEKEFIRETSKLPRWGIISPIGVHFSSNIIFGKVWSNGLSMFCGESIIEPTPIQSADEVMLVLNLENANPFDPSMPSFHLYGTDAIQSLLLNGYKSFAINAPIIHNSLPIRGLGKDFSRAYEFMQRKWRDSLPLNTCLFPITKHGLPLLKFRTRKLVSRLRRKKYVSQRHGNVKSLAAQLGLE